MDLTNYISELNKQFQTGVAREHTYRPALQQLLAEILPDLIVSNEPARQECGAPDFILQRKKDNIPVAFIEAKDIGDTDLAGRNKNKEQFNRYKSSLDNIIFTDYLDFHLYEKGEFVDSICIAELRGNKIVPIKDNFEKFSYLIKHFGNSEPQSITSSAKLAEIMAGKARLLADVIEKSLSKDDDESSNLAGQMKAIKEVLIHDITPKSFADIYAQTITYGMFAARLHDTTPDNFTRQEAATLIPKTNPFLRQLFQNVAGYDLDERISWIVDDLAETFRATDMDEVMKGFGKHTQQTDPIIHFYENFLSAYDPDLRKNRGVWYTPQPIVNFIVRAVDEILQTEFCLSMGLADTSKVKLERSVEQSSDKRYLDNKKKTMVEYHKIQILDPATGTGTFLAEVVNLIYQKFQGQSGMWQSYVEEHLLPRLNGFELLMASYAMAHLKLDWLLTETGYNPIQNNRLRVYLTDSLEKFQGECENLFTQWLANEANEANRIKRNAPVMVVLGNPPYSGESSNKGEWIMNLMEDYKKEPGGKIKLQERNPKWINDDYCKFIRLGQYFVDKNNEGVLAYISNNGFIDNPTFRGMRWNLMKSFDKIYILDLHGNSKKKEVAPDGSKDENVFNIQQGVSINIFVKTGKKTKNELAEIYHHDIYGKQDTKYNYLIENDLSAIKWNKLNPSFPEYFFIPKDYSIKNNYDSGFIINNIFKFNSAGIVTANDKILIGKTKSDVYQNVCDYYNIEINENYFEPINYRPFDRMIIYYDTKLIERSREKIMSNFLNKNNLGLATIRINKESIFSSVFITNIMADARLSDRFLTYIFPIYLYPEDTQLTTEGNQIRIPNLDSKIVEKIAKNIGLQFEEEKSGDSNKFAPIDLLDYIYAVLHSPAYREKYKEFLKIDFPRVPYPENEEQFRRLSAIGYELRRVHLMEHPRLTNFTTQYDIKGNDIVEKPQWESLQDNQYGRVWINSEQYFDNVPLVAWEFYIGGYQPAQKWLKDRKGRLLKYEDIMHYQKIIKALVMTDELMREIDD